MKSLKIGKLIFNRKLISFLNVSSFLAYLLDPNEDQGISSLLLQELLNDIIEINKDFLAKIQFNSRISDLSRYS